MFNIKIASYIDHVPFSGFWIPMKKSQSLDTEIIRFIVIYIVCTESY
jgi:hypothetical protein